MTENYFLGWKGKAPEDKRDFSIRSLQVSNLFKDLPTELPESIDLRKWCIPVLNQGSLGSCTANAAVELMGYLYNKLGKANNFLGSRLAQYYWTRLLEGNPNEDTGAYIRDAVKILAKMGVAQEVLWSYDTNKFTKPPSKKVEKDALKRQAINYVLIDQPGMKPEEVIFAVKQQLTVGNCMEFGTNVYQSIMKVGKDGIIPEPKEGENPVGGHALFICGFSNQKRAFLLQNSWGPEWGDNGFGWLPYSYFEKGEACDIWTVVDATFNK
jgi:C1A family cysteine protease